MTVLLQPTDTQALMALCRDVNAEGQCRMDIDLHAMHEGDRMLLYHAIEWGTGKLLVRDLQPAGNS